MELAAVTINSKAQTTLRKVHHSNVSFCTHVGWDGILILFCMSTIGALFLFLVYMYTQFNKIFDREFIWVFLLMSGIYWFKIISRLIRWRSEVHALIEEEFTEPGNDSISWYKKLKTIKDDFQVYGKYYLWNLYSSEIAESFMQLYNLYSVYLCSMPIGFSTAICLFLSIECFYTVTFVMKDNSVTLRDRQYKLDAIIDFLCTTVPLCIIWFGYQVPISVNDMLVLTVVPGIMLLLKSNTIFDEIIRFRTANAILRAQQKVSAKVQRRRKSLFDDVTHFNIAKEQQENVPYFVRIGVGFCKFAFGCLFLISAIIQIGVPVKDCQPELLWNGCIVKTPFCENPFQTSCNCAVVEIKNHNWTALPNEMKAMTTLKRAQINHGPLRVLFNDFENYFTKLSLIDFSYNALTHLPIKFGGGVELNKLKLANNNLNSIPDITWGNRYLHWLELDNNNISEISSAVLNAETLQLLLMSNNSLKLLPKELFISSRTNMNSNLITLFVDGNYIVDIPADVKYASNLRSFKVHNNYVKNLPKEVGTLKRMYDIDLRNNSLSKLPLSFLELKDSLKFIYLHNNPICRNGWLEKNNDMKEFVDKMPEAGCEKQCSIYCQNRFLTRKPCVRECNSIECDFQGGICML